MNGLVTPFFSVFMAPHVGTQDIDDCTLEGVSADIISQVRFQLEGLTVLERSGNTSVPRLMSLLHPG